MHPRKFFEIWVSEMAFIAFWGHFWAKYIGLKSHFEILGLWNGISCILSALLSKIYRFEIQSLTVYLVKKCFRTFRGGGHGRMAPPPKYATVQRGYPRTHLLNTEIKKASSNSRPDTGLNSTFLSRNVKTSYSINILRIRDYFVWSDFRMHFCFRSPS